MGLGNLNPGTQVQASLAWDGAANYPENISGFNIFGFGFQTVAPIVVDACFRVEAAPPSAADRCVPGPFVPVPEIATCMGEAIPAGQMAEICIPAGTPAGARCSGTIPCRPDVFVRLVPISGDTANVRAFHILHGPN